MGYKQNFTLLTSFKINFFVFILALFCAFSFVINNFNFSTSQLFSTVAETTSTNETDETTESYNLSDETTYSIFIKNPSYSFEYSNNLYFFDLSDGYLKIFSILDNKFYSNYLDLSSNGTLVDASISNNFIFYLFCDSNNNFSIVKITLDPENLISDIIIDSSQLNTASFTKISVTYFSSDYYIILTPKIESVTSTDIEITPVIFIYNSDSNMTSHKTEIKFGSSINNSIKTSLFKVMLTKSSSSDEICNIILACKLEVYASNLVLSSLSENESIELTDTSFYRTLDSYEFDETTYQELSVISINFLEFENLNIMSVTYMSTTLSGTTSSYTKFYNFSLSLYGTGSTFELMETMIASLSNYVSSSSSGLVYPADQEILYVQINLVNGSIDFTKYVITNPTLSISYYEEDEFIYVETIASTSLLSSPWASSEIINIESGYDLIIIGSGVILSQNLTFTDYKYCLMTYNNENYLGYVKTETLTLKEEKSIDDNSKICTVISNTPLFSLPTKITGTTINSSLSSTLLINIPEYSKVEILDWLGNYTSNNTIWAKVCVNNSSIGYIDISQIQNKNEINIYVTNNATIKLDGAKLYLSEDNTDVYSLILNSETRIQVNGTRNRATGLSSVTYCDEYGNVFSGYISSDYIQMDGWTNLQIVGSIFIAVNIGFLILIFYFKKHRLTTKDSKDITSPDEETVIDS